MKKLLNLIEQVRFAELDKIVIINDLQEKSRRMKDRSNHSFGK